MDAATVQSLLRDVRRRLWMQRFDAAARWALWGSASLMLIAGAVHLAGLRVAVEDLLLVLAAAWVVAMAWAAWQRPSEALSALWADRHLGGASAYSTLLEAQDRTRPLFNATAVLRLQAWAVAQVPAARALLSARRDPSTIAKPLIFALVAAALAALVLTRPPMSRSESIGGVAQAAAHAARPAAADAAPLASSGLAKELESAMRSAKGRDPLERGGVQLATGDRVAGNERVATAMPPDPSMLARGAQAADATTASPASANAGGARSGTRGTGTEGREGGDSHGDAPRNLSSRASQEALPMQTHATSGREAVKQADMEQPGRFDDDPPARANPRSGPRGAAAAAIPPRAANFAALAPAEAVYVNAWVKTLAERR